MNNANLSAVLDQAHPVRAVAEDDYRAGLARVNSEAIARMARPEGLQGLGSTLAGSPLAGRINAFVPYFIAMNVLNYQFWELDAQGAFQRYSHNGAIGALAMQNSVLQHWTEALAGAAEAGSIRDQVGRVTGVLRERIEREGVAFLLGDIPRADSRRALLLEVLDADKLTIVAEYLAARVTTSGELGWGDAQVLAYLFPKCYADRYLKKAQLTLMFIAGEYNATGPVQRCRLNVTAAADYQLPKVLRALGVLEYSDALVARVDGHEPIAEDSTEERAIRAATIIACDALAKHFGVTMEEIDFWLWVNRNAAREARFHLTETTAY